MMTGIRDAGAPFASCRWLLGLSLISGSWGRAQVRGRGRWCEIARVLGCEMHLGGGVVQCCTCYTSNVTIQMMHDARRTTCA